MLIHSYIHSFTYIFIENQSFIRTITLFETSEVHNLHSPPLYEKKKKRKYKGVTNKSEAPFGQKNQCFCLELGQILTNEGARYSPRDKHALQCLVLGQRVQVCIRTPPPSRRLRSGLPQRQVGDTGRLMERRREAGSWAWGLVGGCGGGWERE